MLLDINNKVEIDIEFGKLKPLLNWCEKNCTGEWKYNIIDPAGDMVGQYTFFFEDKNDKLNFILWQK